MNRDEKSANDSMELYEAPFRFSHGYIFDAKGNTFSDCSGGEEETFAARIRGWGRISYYKNSEALQDEIGEHMAKALTEYWNKHRASK